MQWIKGYQNGQYNGYQRMYLRMEIKLKGFVETKNRGRRGSDE